MTLEPLHNISEYYLAKKEVEILNIKEQFGILSKTEHDFKLCFEERIKNFKIENNEQNKLHTTQKF